MKITLAALSLILAAGTASAQELQPITTPANNGQATQNSGPDVNGYTNDKYKTNEGFQIYNDRNQRVGNVLNKPQPSQPLYQGNSYSQPAPYQAAPAQPAPYQPVQVAPAPTQTFQPASPPAQQFQPAPPPAQSFQPTPVPQQLAPAQPQGISNLPPLNPAELQPIRPIGNPQ